MSTRLRKSGNWLLENWLELILGVVLGVFFLGSLALAAAVVYRASLFNFDLPFTDDQLSPVLTFLAAGFAASATALGALFTRSYNKRTHALAQEAEDRLRNEAAAKFLPLIAAQNGDPPSATQMSAVLVGLVSLGHVGMALGIVATADLDGPTFARIVNFAIEGGNAVERRAASGLLRDRAPKLIRDEPPGDFDWPHRLADGAWPSEDELVSAGRLDVLVAIVRVLDGRELTEWCKHPDRLGTLILLLEGAIQTEKDPELAAGAWLVESYVLAATPQAMALAGENRTIRDLETSHAEKANQHEGVRWIADLERAVRELYDKWDAHGSGLKARLPSEAVFESDSGG